MRAIPWRWPVLIALLGCSEDVAEPENVEQPAAGIQTPEACADGQTLVYNRGRWLCEALPELPTLGPLAEASLPCAVGQVAKLGAGGLWTCGVDEAGTVDEAQVDAWVANNGYLLSESQFEASPAASITDAMVDRWQAAESRVEADPIFAASPAAAISTEMVAAWQALNSGLDSTAVNSLIAADPARQGWDAAAVELAAARGGFDSVEERFSALEDLVAQQADAIAALGGDQGHIGGERTIGNGGDYDDLPAALAALGGHRISNAGLTLRVLPGTHAWPGLDLHHPDGHLLSLIGDPSNPDAVTIEFTGDQSGFTVRDQHRLRRVAGLTLSNAGGVDNKGIIVADGGTLAVDNVRITAFKHGLIATDGGAVYATDVVFTDNREGAKAERGGSFFCATGCRFTDNDDGGLSVPGGTAVVRNAIASGNDIGFVVSQGGRFHCENCTARDNAGSGFEAATAAQASLLQPRSYCNGDGYLAHYGATLDSNASLAWSNANTGWQVQAGGTLIALDSAATADTSGACADGSAFAGNGTDFDPATAYDPALGQQRSLLVR